MFKAIILVLATVTTSCSHVNKADSSGTKGEVVEQNLWAGSTTYNITRETNDPCGKGRELTQDIIFGSWARQRASFTNICFQVWKPGVTDNDNGTFWQFLDVQAHYRFAGDDGFQTQHVDSIRRQGDNRLYAWDVRQFDPFVGNCFGSKVKFTVTQESGTTVAAEASLEVYFTVNGKVLNKADGWNYYVKYSGVCAKAALGG